MSNTQRPSLAKKQTPASEAKRKQELDQSFAIRVDGVDYVLTPSELTGVQEMEIRRQTGYSVTTLIREITLNPGVDLIGIFKWACNLSQGKPADLLESLESVSYASDVDVIGEDVEPASPEA
ncbi:hypothetical protein [Aeromicrobium sp.]|uniref:hypothetical protein n=1 Tax=Aeromicrobium sp. TaxID=1871063 RepID=UPI002FC8B72E